MDENGGERERGLDDGRDARSRVFEAPIVYPERGEPRRECDERKCSVLNERDLSKSRRGTEREHEHERDGDREKESEARNERVRVVEKHVAGKSGRCSPCRRRKERVERRNDICSALGEIHEAVRERYEVSCRERERRPRDIPFRDAFFKQKPGRENREKRLKLLEKEHDGELDEIHFEEGRREEKRSQDARKERDEADGPPLVLRQPLPFP